METLITKVLSLGDLKPEYIQVLLSHMDEYRKAFTSESVDIYENYEVLEHLGDGIVNSFLSFYFFRRLPHLDCTSGVKILSRLKINYASSRSFADIAERLGFWPYIRASPEQKRTYKTKLLEDTLEAFIGVTVRILDAEFRVGVGYGIAYAILKGVFDTIEISLEYDDLYDSKSKIKEIFDAARGKLGMLDYVNTARTCTLYRKEKGGLKFLLGVGSELPTKAEREQAASKQALRLFIKEQEEQRRLHNQLLIKCGEYVFQRNNMR